MNSPPSAQSDAIKESGRTLHEQAEGIARAIQNFGWGSRGAFHHGGLSNSDVTLLARAYLDLKRQAA